MHLGLPVFENPPSISAFIGVPMWCLALPIYICEKVEFTSMDLVESVPALHSEDDPLIPEQSPNAWHVSEAQGSTM